MTPAIILIGSLIIFASVLIIAVILPWATISEQPIGYFPPPDSARGRGPENLRPRMAAPIVIPSLSAISIGTWAPNGSPNPGIT